MDDFQTTNAIRKWKWWLLCALSHITSTHKYMQIFHKYTVCNPSALCHHSSKSHTTNAFLSFYRITSQTLNIHGVYHHRFYKASKSHRPHIDATFSNYIAAFFMTICAVKYIEWEWTSNISVFVRWIFLAKQLCTSCGLNKTVDK